MHVVSRDILDRLRVIVESWDDGEHGCSGLGDCGHIADLNQVQWSLTHAEDESPPLLQADVRGTLYKIPGQAVSDPRKCSHGAWEYDHRVDWIGTRCDRCTNILMRKQYDFFRRAVQELFYQRVPATNSHLFGEDAKRAWRDDQMDATNAFIRFERPQHLH